jgi:aspartate carbamoyltransferase catalytic subunit
VINAGDGAHEHPTQTLCDLYNLHVERGHIEGLEVVLAGDLKYSRTVHSFAYALARFGAGIVCVPQPGFEMPEYVVRRLREEFGVEPVRADTRRLGALAAESDAMYLTPQKPHQLSLFTDARGWELQHVDALYMTRPQTERFDKGDGGSGQYMRLERRDMAVESLRDAVVMHPLPRRDEISSDIDEDPRSIYFKQASRGVPIRMALLSVLMGKIELPGDRPQPVESWPVSVGANPCPNPSCISRTEPRHVEPRFVLASRQPLRARCAYCSRDLLYSFVGCSTTQRYHPPGSAALRKVRPDHLVFLSDADQAGLLEFFPAGG